MKLFEFKLSGRCFFHRCTFDHRGNEIIFGVASSETSCRICRNKSRSDLLESGKLMAQAERDFDKVRGELSEAVATIAEMKSRFLEQDARRAKAERACKRSKAEAEELRKVRSSSIIEAGGASRKGMRGRAIDDRTRFESELFGLGHKARWVRPPGSRLAKPAAMATGPRVRVRVKARIRVTQTRAQLPRYWKRNRASESSTWSFDAI